MRRAIAGALVALLLLSPAPARAQGCSTFWITGYFPDPAAGFNAYTADGTPAFTPEPIVAAPGWVAFDTLAAIEGVGTFRVADRGYLGQYHIDVRVFSLAEAYRLTGYRTVCFS